MTPVEKEREFTDSINRHINKKGLEGFSEPAIKGFVAQAIKFTDSLDLEHKLGSEAASYLALLPMYDLAIFLGIYSSLASTATSLICLQTTAVRCAKTSRTICESGFLNKSWM